MKIRIPLVRREVGGIRCFSPEITLAVQSRYGDFVEVRFVVDTGADFSALRISLAREKHLSYSEAREGTVSGLVGLAKKYRHVITLRIRGEEFTWPCDFIETPRAATERPENRRTAVLGRAGLLDEFDMSLTQTHLILTRRGRLRRVWNAVWAWFIRLARLETDPESPL